MDAMTLVGVFVAILIVWALIGRRVERFNRRSELEKAMMRAQAQLDDLSLAIGEQLLPPMRQAVKAFESFADSLRRGAS